MLSKQRNDRTFNNMFRSAQELVRAIADECLIGDLAGFRHLHLLLPASPNRVHFHIVS